MGVAVLLTLSGAVAAAQAPAAEPSAATPMALQCGHLLDVENGRLLNASTVVIQAGKVQQVQSGIQSPAGAKLIDLGAQTCLPGLIDTHTHLTAEFSKRPLHGTVPLESRRLRDPLARSTRGARCWPASRPCAISATATNESIALRNAINAGVVPGPRIFTAGSPIGSTGGHADATDGYREDLAGDPGAEGRHHQ